MAPFGVVDFWATATLPVSRRCVFLVPRFLRFGGFFLSAPKKIPLHKLPRPCLSMRIMSIKHGLNFGDLGEVLHAFFTMVCSVAGGKEKRSIELAPLHRPIDNKTDSASNTSLATYSFFERKGVRTSSKTEASPLRVPPSSLWFLFSPVKAYFAFLPCSGGATLTLRASEIFPAPGSVHRGRKGQEACGCVVEPL